MCTRFPSSVSDPSLTFFSARRPGLLLGIGALKQLEARHGEVKSMHTTQSARQHGVGRAIVEHLLAVARERRYERVSLETGTMEAFAPAHAPTARLASRSVRRSATNSVCMTILLGNERTSAASPRDHTWRQPILTLT
ncbi:MAG: GNAT family N-acetyltransferase [Dehalococcoidia bacterium]|nr:GNAT family N-acetyltransferase [Dehalococcoidia bacterium]